MKKISLVLSFSIILFNVNSQLSYNNTSVSFSKNGKLFYDESTSSAGYEVPKNTGKYALNSGGFWLTALDSLGNLKVASTSVESDFSPGPYGGVLNSSFMNKYVNPDFTVSKNEIDFHIQFYGTTGYVTPSSILNWPAHGDTTLGISYNLAPFVDVNGDGKYNPQLGDFPKIRGEKATFFMMSDEKLPHLNSAGDPLHVEVHIMFYQFELSEVLNDHTFMNVKIYNRGTSNLYNYKFGIYANTDLGISSDDYIGCDTLNNLIYSFNGTNNDFVYGVNPPAIGLISLKQPMDGFTAFSDNNPFYQSQPTTPVQYYHVLNSRWVDSSPLTYGGSAYGGTIPTKFMFPSNPNTLGGVNDWTESSAGLSPSDRSVLMILPQDSLEIGEKRCYDFAVLYAKSNSNIMSVNDLISAAGSVQYFYNSSNFSCEEVNSTLALIEFPNEIKHIHLYPNPTKGDFQILLGDTELSGQILIKNIDGRIVQKQTFISKKEIKISLIENPGVYFITVDIREGSKIHDKIILSK